MSLLHRISHNLRHQDAKKTNFASHFLIALCFVFISASYLGYLAYQTSAQNQHIWYDDGVNDYQYRQKITLNEDYLIDQTDAVVTVIVPEGNPVFSKTLPEGWDIVFVSADNANQLDYETEIFDPVLETALFRVKIPALSAGVDADIYMYYGDSNITESSEADLGAVYSDDYGIFYEMDISGLDSAQNHGVDPVRDRVADIGTPIDNDLVLGLGVEFDGVARAWSMANMPYWESGWSDRVHNLVFETSDDITSRQVLFAEGGGTNGVMLYIFESNLYARWWSESQGWSGDELVTSRNLSTNTIYYATMSYSETGTYNLYLNGEEVDPDPTHMSGVLMNAHSGDGGIAYTGTNTKDFHDQTTAGHYFNGVIAQLEVLDTTWTLDQHTFWFNMLSQNDTFLEFANEESQSAFGPKEGIYISQEFELAATDSEAYVSSLDNFSAAIGVDEVYPESGEDPQANTQIDLYAKFIKKDGSPLGISGNDDGEWFFKFNPDEPDLNAKFIDLNISEIATVQFKIYLQTNNLAYFLPWVESLNFSYTIQDDSLWDVGEIVFTSEDTQEVEIGEPATYEIELTPATEYYELINEVTLNIEIDEETVTADPVVITIDHEASPENYTEEIILNTTSESLVGEHSFNVVAVVTNPADQPNFYIENITGYISIIDSTQNIVVNFTAPEEGDVWYFENTENIVLEGSFNTELVTDSFVLTYYLGVIDPPGTDTVDPPGATTYLFSEGVTDYDIVINPHENTSGLFTVNIPWEVGVIYDGTRIDESMPGLELSDNFVVGVQVNSLDDNFYYGQYWSDIFSMVEPGTVITKPAVGITAIVNLAKGLSEDGSQPLFNFRLYQKDVTDGDDYTIEAIGLQADSYDAETYLATVSINIEEGQVLDGETYEAYLRSNRHLWAKATTPPNGEITIDAEHPTHNIIFPELIAGDINTDNLINSIDFTRAIQDFYRGIENLLPDFNNDGDVTTTDLGYIFGSWFVEGELPYEE